MNKKFVLPTRTLCLLNDFDLSFAEKLNGHLRTPIETPIWIVPPKIRSLSLDTCLTIIDANGQERVHGLVVKERDKICIHEHRSASNLTVENMLSAFSHYHSATPMGIVSFGKRILSSKSIEGVFIYALPYMTRNYRSTLSRQVPFNDVFGAANDWEELFDLQKKSSLYLEEEVDAVHSRLFRDTVKSPIKTVRCSPLHAQERLGIVLSDVIH